MADTKETINKVINSVDPVFFELSNYTSPEITEVQREGFVAYGEDNLYFSYLLDRFRGSPTNSAIISAVSKMIAGEGITSPFQTRHPQEFMTAAKWFSLDKLTKWAFDLKCFGFFTMQIIRSRNGKINDVEFTPVDSWRSGIANEEGDVNEWYYSDDWVQWELTKNAKFAPVVYPAYERGANDSISIFACKPYKPGSFYYPSVDYQGSLQWSHIEEEVGNFHLNNILNGFSPSLIINFNNGDPGPEIRQNIERKVNSKMRGSSKAGIGLLSFNDDATHAVTIEAAPISDLDKQFQFISEEATRKIMVGHRVTSPLFFGIRDGAGLGSNSDEIKNSWLFFQNMEIQPIQRFIIGCFEQLLIDSDMWIKLSIQDLTPLEFEQPQHEPTKTALSGLPKFPDELMDLFDEWIDQNGMSEEEILKDFDLLDSRPVDYDNELELDGMIKGFQLATAVKSNPNQKSAQDNDLFQVRYAYAPAKINQGPKGSSRDFCRKMVSARKVYRKEDIEAASKIPVNAGWGPHGSDTYDIWLYKGGGNCLHFWERRLYLKKNNQRISAKQAQDLISKLPPSKRSEVRPEHNPAKVAKLPHDMQYNGFLPDNPVYGINRQ